ncbi:MAG: hypothetical protein ABL856_12365, partial [Gallionella sp.]
MTYATLHTTNHPRRIHPAVDRAALRSHVRLIKQTDSSIAKNNNNSHQPTQPQQILQSRAVWVRVLSLLLMMCLPLYSFAALPDNKAIFDSGRTDLVVKVKHGEITIQHGFFEGKWYQNLNWIPLLITYDSFDGSVMSLTRGQAEYLKAAPGVYQDQN